MKIDPYKSKRAYLNWRGTWPGNQEVIAKKNSEAILQFLDDMEMGINTNGPKKGSRSYIRLNKLRQKLIFLARKLEEQGVNNILLVKEEELHNLFSGMRTGRIPKKSGGAYRSTGEYVKEFKSFWHWHMKVQRKKGEILSDICEDLDASSEKPRWVHVSEEQVKTLCEHAKFKYKVLIMFLFDSGIRSPTELVNVKVNDLEKDCTTLQIRDEISKTFGRKINLLLCTNVLRRFIQEQELQEEDYLFQISPPVVNRYLRRLAKRILGIRKSPGGDNYSNLTMYDFRHSSACYWVPRYKSESALKYRFGWKKSEEIHYYTELIGMKDTITQEDLHLAEEKTKIETKLQEAEGEKRLLQEELDNMRTQMQLILETVNTLKQKVG